MCDRTQLGTPQDADPHPCFFKAFADLFGVAAASPYIFKIIMLVSTSVGLRLTVGNAARDWANMVACA